MIISKIYNSEYRFEVWSKEDVSRFFKTFEKNKKEDKEEGLILTMGFQNSYKQLIVVTKDIAKGAVKSTLIHEISHAILNTFALHSEEEMNSEKVCDFMGYHFEEILKVLNEVYPAIIKEWE